MRRVKVIHVNRGFISSNAKDGGDRPVYIVRDGRDVRYAREVQINGPSRLVYNGSQLLCGARAWIETEANLILVDEMRFADAKALGGAR